MAAKPSFAAKHPPAPRLARGAFDTLQSMPLDAKDAYVLSRIDGVTLPHEIVDACGLDPNTVTEALNRLTALGLIRWDREAVSAEHSKPPSNPPVRVSGVCSRRNNISEAVAAPKPGLRERFERLNHYQILGLYMDCHHDEVELAHERARGLEPGTLAARMASRLGAERVLERVGAAYEVLRSAERRRKYDEYLLCKEETRAIEDALSEGVRRASVVPPPAAPSPSTLQDDRKMASETTPSVLPADEITTDFLVAAIRSQAPRSGRRKRAEELVRSAIAERDDANLVGATNALRLANSIQPGCPALEGALATTTKEMNKRHAPTFRAQALFEESLFMWEAAAKTWEKVLLGEPEDTQAALGVANATLEAGGDLKRALECAELAARGAPDDPACHRVLARAYIAAGMTRNAERALQCVKRLEPKTDDRGLLGRVIRRWHRD